jgi:hypothetical protein
MNLFISTEELTKAIQDDIGYAVEQLSVPERQSIKDNFDSVAPSIRAL